MNFQLFSDLAMALRVEIEEMNIAKLYDSLVDEFHLPVIDTTEFNSTSNKEWIVFINLSFGQGTGDMRHEVPEVPG